jgi:small-conductance mechanosensitive channel
VTARLRDLARSLKDDAAFATMEAEVSSYAHRAAVTWNETGRLLGRNLRTTALDSLATSWDALRNELEDVGDRIDARAHRREADLASLTTLHASWTHALELARKAEAPAPVVERIENTLTAIDQIHPKIAQRLARVLVLQDSVTRAEQLCDHALARIGDAREDAIRRALTPQEPPVWRDERPPAAPGVAGGSSAAIALRTERIVGYATAHGGGLIASAIVILALVMLLRRHRAGFADPTMSIVRTPHAAAILIGLLLTRPLRPNPPFELQQVILSIVMVAAVLVFRPILPGRLATAVYLCGGVLIGSLASQLLEPETRLEQALLMAELGVIAALLAWIASLFSSDERLGADAPTFRRAGAVVLRVLAIICAGSAVAAAFGFLDLADFLGLGLFFALLLAFGLLAVRLTLHDFVGVALSQGPLARLHTVARHRAAIARRARAVVDVILAGVWGGSVLSRFELADDAQRVVRAVLDARLQAGELDLPMAHALAFMGVVIGVFVATRVVVVLLEEDVYSRMTLPRGVPYALSTLTRYAFLLIGFLLALGTLGLDLTRITVLVSAVGLGLGFGLQQVMNNFVSGLILLFERPVKVGDSIEMESLSGDVMRIGIRSSTIRTSQGAEVIVPNSKIIEDRVTNWTLSDRRRQLQLDVRARPDVDAECVIALLNDVARRDDRVSKLPPPETLLVRFGDDVTVYRLCFWTDETGWTRLRSDVAIAVQRAMRADLLDDAGTRPAAGSRSS